MAERSSQELLEMMKRIPTDTLSTEIIEYFRLNMNIQEVRDVMKSFLEFYVSERRLR